MACTYLDNLFNGALKVEPKQTTFRAFLNTSKWESTGIPGPDKQPPPLHLVAFGSGERKLVYTPAHIEQIGKFVKLAVPATLSGEVNYQAPAGGGETSVLTSAPGGFGPLYMVTLHSPGSLTGSFVPSCMNSMLMGTTDELVVTIRLVIL